MPKVYVVQESPGKNILSASDFGEEVIVLLPSDRQVMFSPEHIVSELEKKLNQFTDDDYLVLIGDPAAIGIACAVAAWWNGGRFKVLKWDKQETKYYPIQIAVGT